MRTIDLDGLWQGCLPGRQPQPMRVPGCFDTYSPRKDIAHPVALERVFSLDKRPGMRYALAFGAVSYFCDVFVNDRPAGSHEGMWDSFLLDVTDLVQNGENRLRLLVTKPGYHDSDPFPLRQVLSGFIPDVLYTFGGIWDHVQLLESACIFPEYHFANGAADGSFHFEAGLFAAEDPACPPELSLTVEDAFGAVQARMQQVFPVGARTLCLDGRLERPALWSPQNPALYRYTARIRCGAEELVLGGSFGFRTVSGQGSRLLLNGQPIYLRGALHWGYYDKTVTPTPSDETVEAEIRAVRQYGMNALKHCLYIPRQNYLQKADETGLLQWVELPLWLPEATPELPARIRREYPRIIRQLAGHPSIILTSLGCELDAGVGSELLCEMYHLLKDTTRTLVKDNSGSGECYDGLADEYADYFDYHFYADLNQLEPLLDTFTPTWRSDMPWLFGEFCDSDVLRDLSAVREAYGVERLEWEQNDPQTNPICLLKPDFYAHLHDGNMKKSGIAQDFARKYAKSVDHSMVHRKVTLEAARAEQAISGYNITTLRDVPLCPNGLFNDMGQPKFDTARFRQSNDDIVLCPAWDLTRIWMTSDRVQNRERYNFAGGSAYGLHVLLSNYSGADIRHPGLYYSLLQGGHTVLQGSAEAAPVVENGRVRQLGVIRFTLPQVTRPVTYLLKVSTLVQGRTITNEWPVFVYPARQRPALKVGVWDAAGALDTIDTLYDTVSIPDEGPLPACDAIVTTRLVPAVRRFAQQGGRVVLVQRGEGLPALRCPFWREGMLWRDYPSFLNQLDEDCWMDDLRFFSVTAEAALDFGAFPAELVRDYRPVLRRYDCRQWLAHDYIARIGLGRGSIYATTLRLEGGLGKQPVQLCNNRMGVWLLDQMLTAE